MPAATSKAADPSKKGAKRQRSPSPPAARQTARREGFVLVKDRFEATEAAASTLEMFIDASDKKLSPEELLTRFIALRPQMADQVALSDEQKEEKEEEFVIIEGEQ
jgi:hypothetical protein